MTSRGPFRPKTFYDSMISGYQRLHKAALGSDGTAGAAAAPDTQLIIFTCIQY